MPQRQVDLHGLRPEQALRRLEQELHTARLAGSGTLLVITGRGLGNRLQQPILRERVASWLAEHGRRFGVRAWREASRGGALELDLAAGRAPDA